MKIEAIYGNFFQRLTKTHSSFKYPIYIDINYISSIRSPLGLCSTRSFKFTKTDCVRFICRWMCVCRCVCVIEPYAKQWAVNNLWWYWRDAIHKYRKKWMSSGFIVVAVLKNKSQIKLNQTLQISMCNGKNGTREYEIER